MEAGGRSWLWLRMALARSWPWLRMALGRSRLWLRLGRSQELVVAESGPTQELIVAESGWLIAANNGSRACLQHRVVQLWILDSRPRVKPVRLDVSSISFFSCWEWRPVLREQNLRSVQSGVMARVPLCHCKAHQCAQLGGQQVSLETTPSCGL